MDRVETRGRKKTETPRKNIISITVSDDEMASLKNWLKLPLARSIRELALNTIFAEKVYISGETYIKIDKSRIRL